MIAAIVLAAGLSARMGRPKQTLRLEGVPMLERTLKALRRTRVDRVVVVLGANAAEVRRSVKFEDEEVVVNARFRDGMSGSLRLGLRAVERDADAAVIALADQPFVSPTTVDGLVEAYLASRAPIVVPVYRGARGNPVLFDRSLFLQIMRIEGDVGAKRVVESHKAELLELEVEDPGVVVDIDTPADFKSASLRPITRRKRSRGAA